MRERFVSKCPGDTVLIASEFSKRLKSGDVVAFFGDLGSGKTTFISAVALALGYTLDVTSPTFTIMNQYLLGDITLNHFDMYRVFGEEDLYSCGFYDYAGQEGNICLIEWSENIIEFIDPPQYRITMSSCGGDAREIVIEGGEAQ